jgi:SAM-dependent methyltransferase
MREAVYDTIGRGYAGPRRTDPKLAEAIWRALGDARTVLNVGAGTGSYEPPDRELVAVEPSAVMRAQRPPGAAPVVDAEAERLPFPDDAFDAAMAVLTDHHWRDRLAGLRELRRVARRRVVLFNFEPSESDRFWLTREYLSGFLDLIDERFRAPGAWLAELRGVLGEARATVVPIPHDCADGFYGAHWRRPDAYLEPAVRAAISVFALLDPAEVGDGLRRLQADLASGRWEREHRALLDLPALDLGYRVVVAELAASRPIGSAAP